MSEASIAARADYADAILVARRAKNALFLILLVTLIGEIALFFVARKSEFLSPQNATTQPVINASISGLHYLVSLAQFVGLAGSILLVAVLMLLTIVLLTGRTLGVAKVTSACITAIVLAVLLFPWQAVLASPVSTSTIDPAARDLKIPGVLYTWPELTHPTLGANFDSTSVSAPVVLRWARFVGFPAVAVILLMSIQIKSSVGIKAALGEGRGGPIVPADQAI